jgi:hypothetical protein
MLPCGSEEIHTRSAGNAVPLGCIPLFTEHRRVRREVGWEGVDSVRLAQDRDHWRNHLNTVMKLRVR